MKNNQMVPQFSDVLEEVNFILYGSTAGKPEEQNESAKEEQMEVSMQ